MGVVYVGVRADETFEKRVAVKLIKRGMDTEEIVRRFEKERRILAGLDHPHIARILDGGTTAEDLPYFVMEHVDGLPILEYCDSRRLSTTERLKLFREICSAVAFAHQNLVVHRDLKPSNILVDSNGDVRLLDFGIAKLLTADDRGTQTVAGSRPMTPWYSSPEQIRGQTITTASDVYSLGVLLYELLVGRLPYRTTSRAPTEVEQAVCEEEPERPSLAAMRPEPLLKPEGAPAPSDPEERSATREGDSKKLRRRLTGDLDTIVLLALQKDPRRRYASVEQLSEDIRRHLSGLPIRARKDTLLYRSGKFVRRHAFGVAAAAAFVLLALGATTYMAVQGRKIERERLKAEQTSAFLLGLFQSSDPREARGASLTVREILDRGAARIERELSNQPEVQATLMDTIGGVYRELGLLEPARRMIEKAYQTRRRLFGPEDLRVAESLHSLGELNISAGDYVQAEARLRESLRLRSRVLGEKNRLVAESLHDLSAALFRKGDWPGSEVASRRALAIQRELLGERDLAVADSWSLLGASLQSQGKYQEAEIALRKALDITRESPGLSHPNVTGYLNNLGTLMMAQGKFAEAAQFYRESTEYWRRKVGEEHPDYAGVLANLAAALDLAGKTEEAEPLSRRALAIRRRTLGDDHPDVAFSWNGLATILRSKGDPRGAEEAVREALRIFRANLPPRHLLLSAPLLTLGWARSAAGQTKEGEGLLREALEIRSKNLKEGDWRIAEAQSLLATSLSRQGRSQEAAALLAKSVPILQSKLGPSHRLTREALAQIETLPKGSPAPVN